MVWVDAVKQLSPIDIKWFYKIQEKGLCIHRKDLYKIIKDPKMPKDVKKQIKKVFQYLWSNNEKNIKTRYNIKIMNRIRTNIYLIYNKACRMARFTMHGL